MSCLWALLRAANSCKMASSSVPTTEITTVDPRDPRPCRMLPNCYVEGEEGHCEQRAAPGGTHRRVAAVRRSSESGEIQPAERDERKRRSADDKSPTD
ncbi:hypothetical protein EYF80_000228 [Liparis tanakae]|uniref:Uncharacterized protein n=1 Tax=Liparis tanakae TaxID=230148 RepID=A0A4Z2JH76_9TELE|nr:hypothetical protein EYF80_000228 [Liparis tanakae]